MTTELIHQMITLFGLIGVGYIINKAGVLDETANRYLSSFLLKVALPATILNSAIVQRDADRQTVLSVLLVAVGIFILIPVLSKLYAAVFHLEATYQLMLNYSNLGFMGFPIVTSLYGEDKGLYVAVFMMVFNVHIFTAGVVTLQGKLEDGKALIKKLLTPGILSAILSCFIFVFGVPVPDALSGIIRSVGGVTTPLAMIVIGSQLARVNLLESLKTYQLYLMSLCKLLIWPVVVYVILSVLTGPGIVTNIATILVGLPVAGNVTMLCSEYDGDVLLAAQGTCISTLLSLITIPVMISLL